MALAVLELAGVLAAMAYVERRAGRTLQISDEGISVSDNQGKEVSSIRWFELGHVSERQAMRRLVLWDQSGRERVVVDQQYNPSAPIRERIFDEYAKVFTPSPLPVQFRRTQLWNPQSLFFGFVTVLFLSLTWLAYRDNARGPAVLFAGFAILSLISLLSLYPQLRGPSVLFEDRLVLCTLSKRTEFLRKDIASIEMEDAADGTGTKVSFIVVKASDDRRAKITSVYGNIPEIYLTLKAWFAR